MSIVTRIRGGDGSVYLTRIKLTPKIFGWKLMLHIIHRDPHDHPWDFWTLPIRGYSEDVYYPHSGKRISQSVRYFKFHRRSKSHAHRILNRPDGKKIVTLVLHGPKRDDWGFWVVDRDYPPKRFWVHWRQYLAYTI